MKAITNRLQALGLGLCLSGAFSPAVLHAELAAETMADFTSKPIVSADSATPMVMIAASNDHQNFFKAYNDYSDLDRDGVNEIALVGSFMAAGAAFAEDVDLDVESPFGIASPEELKANSERFAGGATLKTEPASLVLT